MAVCWIDSLGGVANSSGSQNYRETSAIPDGTAVTAARLGLITALRRTSVFLQLIVQRFQADSKNFGSPGLVISRRLQGAQNQPLFRFVHRGSDRHLYLVRIDDGRSIEPLRSLAVNAGGSGCRCRTTPRRVPTHCEAREHFPAVIGLELAQQVRLNAGHLAAMAFIHRVNHRIGNQGDIFPMSAKRRHLDIENIQPIKQIIVA